jgi:hypothetical protein
MAGSERNRPARSSRDEERSDDERRDPLPLVELDPPEEDLRS